MQAIWRAVNVCALNFRDVTAADKHKRTALHNACACRSASSAKLVECLLEAGAEVGQYTDPPSSADHRCIV